MGMTPAEELRAVRDDLLQMQAAGGEFSDVWGTSRQVSSGTPGARLVKGGKQTRYLSLAALPERDWDEARGVASFVLNSLSDRATIVRPEVVAGSEGRLLRLRLDWYGIDPLAWEAMVSGVERYWHLVTEVIDPRTGKPRVVVTDGGWVGLDVAAEVRRLSGSIGAVMRLDQFVAVATNTGAGGFYYELARVPEQEREFLAAIGVDAKLVGALRGDLGANVIRSGVTQKLRRVVRRQGPLGGAWQTYDVARNTAERDPLRNPFGFEYDAGEHIAARANGLHWFALYDQKGKRQETVPDAIGKDASDVHGSGIIRPMVSCVRCHVEAGLRPVANDQRELLEGQVALYAERPEDADRLTGFYGGDLEKRLWRDREDYEQAVRAATDGMSGREVADSLSRMVWWFVDELVTPERAARELGVTVDEMQQAWRGARDVVLLALAAGTSVQREQWEAAFAEGALLTAK
jgi:hypothetical protein